MNIYILAFLLLFRGFLYRLPSRIAIPDRKTRERLELQTSFLNLLMADKPGRTSAKGCQKICGIDSIRGNSFFANDKGLFLRVGNGLYHSTPNATAPFWTKEIFPDEHSSIAPGKSGILPTITGV